MYRQTYLEVDCDALKNNIINIKENYPDYKYYFGVVKANAYGHGAYIINSLIKGGVNYLAVSSLEEAIDLRKYNKEIPILVLEPINLNYIEDAIQNNITITISNIEYFKKLLNINLSSTLKFHIKIDSGMNRLGLNNSTDLEYVVENCSNNSNLYLEGIYSHFATSGINDKHWDDQLEKFKEITKNISLSNIPIVHLNRSLSLVNHPKISFCNGTRLGIVMYGMSQSMAQPTGIRAKLREIKNSLKRKKLSISETTTTNNLQLNTAITLCSEVIDLKEIHINDFVGYGAEFVATENAKIATVAIGYADGIPKTIKHVAINNKIFNVVGEVCMDMISVKVDDSVSIGDKVIILDNSLLPVKKVAMECGISSYTLFTGITTRVPRVYKENGQETEIKY
jgi:alanine racemase